MGLIGGVEVSVNQGCDVIDGYLTVAVHVGIAGAGGFGREVGTNQTGDVVDGDATDADTPRHSATVGRQEIAAVSYLLLPKVE